MKRRATCVPDDPPPTKRRRVLTTYGFTKKVKKKKKKKRAISQFRDINDPNQVPDGSMQLIYADPPWRYDVRKCVGAAEDIYPTMSMEELKALPVSRIAAPTSILLMWTTGPKLSDALSLIKAWGFSYVTIFLNWHKTDLRRPGLSSTGLGHYTRPTAEPLLLGSRGPWIEELLLLGKHGSIYKTFTRKTGKSVPSVMYTHRAPRREHSRKPDGVYRRIFRVFSEVDQRKSIELFARSSYKRMWYWGNHEDMRVVM